VDNLAALNDLIYRGYVVKVGTIWMPTNATWLALGLADPPTITGVSSSSTTPTTPVTITGRGDATDTITIYEGSTVVPTTTLVTVGADGTWTAVVYLPVGQHNLRATQTVQELPQIGLQSAQSNEVDLNSYPAAPSITSVSMPGPAVPTAAVTVSGTGVVGYSVTVFENGHSVATVSVGAGGTWSATLNLSVGVHALSATTAVVVAGTTFTSNAGSGPTVTVYAPPAAPQVSPPPTGTVSSQPLISGHGLAGATVKVYEGTVEVGSARVAADGTWTATPASLSVGKHTLTAKQRDAASGFWSAASPTFSVTINPDPPAILPIAQPTASGPVSVTVTITGTAGYAVTLYDGTTAIASATMSASGSWTVTVTLAVGTHSLTAKQTSPSIGGSTFTSAASAVANVTVYAPTPAPYVFAPSSVASGSTFTVIGYGVVGDTVKIYRGSVEIGFAVVASTGWWTITVAAGSLALGANTLTAKQRDAVSGLWSSGTNFAVTQL
jgi:hypothetical protein